MDAVPTDITTPVSALAVIPPPTEPPRTTAEIVNPPLATKGLGVAFGKHTVLADVDLVYPENSVTAIIGPSGCGKSTYLRALNRMHDLVPTARVSGAALLDGHDILNADAVAVRRLIGMVFQKPNPFPTKSIRDNVLTGPKFNGMRLSSRQRDDLVEEVLKGAGLWAEVRNRLNAPAGSLSGGQQQRLCIARALAVEPRVLLMDEPASALDPISTERIENLIDQLRTRLTIVIVTHNMQQAARVSDYTAFFTITEEGEPGRLIEHGPTGKIFTEPANTRTRDYVTGRFG